MSGWIDSLKEIKINKELEESAAIDSLTLKAFDEKGEKNDEAKLKAALKTTEITVDGENKPLTLAKIAEEFSNFVEKGDGWKLKLIDAKSADAPTWIKNIVENPKNNDLAFFVQKLAGLISYQTAKAYTEEETEALAVGIDKTFGNQTKRALAGLKTWIENDATTEVADGKTFEWKFVQKAFLEWLISDKKDDKEKNTILAKYNLQYVDGQIMPLDDYKFIDPNSNNYAVEKPGDVNKEQDANTENTDTKDKEKEQGQVQGAKVENTEEVQDNNDTIFNDFAWIEEIINYIDPEIKNPIPEDITGTIVEKDKKYIYWDMNIILGAQGQWILSPIKQCTSLKKKDLLKELSSASTIELPVGTTLEESLKLATLINYVARFFSGKQTGTDELADIEAGKVTWNLIEDSNPFYIRNNRLYFSDNWSRDDYDIISRSNLNLMTPGASLEDLAKLFINRVNYTFDNDD